MLLLLFFTHLSRLYILILYKIHSKKYMYTCKVGPVLLTPIKYLTPVNSTRVCTHTQIPQKKNYVVNKAKLIRALSMAL